MIVNPGLDVQQKTIVIVGVQRGGTSMVAGVVRELGINLGTNLGNNHEDPQFLTKNRRQIMRVVGERDEKLDVWGWKMPHSSEYIVKIYRKLRNPHVIVVFRNLQACAESQMNRSGTTYASALKFARNRLNQVASTVPSLKCPLMIVNYEKAVSTPQLFVDELSEFLHLSPAGDVQENAISMVNPKLGYRRVSSERWSCELLTEAIPFGKGSQGGYRRSRRNLVAKEKVLYRTKEVAFFQFDSFEYGTADQMTLSLDCIGSPEEIDIRVDFGNGFSLNLRERAKLKRGRNSILIRGKNIQAIRVFPSFEGDKANIRLLQLDLGQPTAKVENTTQ